jgi:hypothetical protein
MSRDEAMQALEECKRKLQSRIPSSAPLLRARYLRNVVDDEVEAARKHLQALYQSGLEVGPEFAALPAHAADPKCAFWLEGIHRHLRSCESVLAEQPAGA